MLKNKVQIARESIKTTLDMLELPGPLSGQWTPTESEFGSALVMCVRAHNRMPPNENPGSAPDIGRLLICSCDFVIYLEFI